MYQTLKLDAIINMMMLAIILESPQYSECSGSSLKETFLPCSLFVVSKHSKSLGYVAASSGYTDRQCNVNPIWYLSCNRTLSLEDCPSSFEVD